MTLLLRTWARLTVERGVVGQALLGMHLTQCLCVVAERLCGEAVFAGWFGRKLLIACCCRGGTFLALARCEWFGGRALIIVLAHDLLFVQRMCRAVANAQAVAHFVAIEATCHTWADLSCLRVADCRRIGQIHRHGKCTIASGRQGLTAKKSRPTLAKGKLMLRSSKEILKYEVKARDGVVGRVSDFLFDDRSWSVRYLVVETGKWLPGRRILVSVSQCWEPDGADKTIGVNLDKERIESGPALDEDAPVSRQYEIEFARHFQLVPYWATAGLTGQRVPMTPAAAAAEMEGHAADDDGGDPHLRSMREVAGYSIAALNGKIGHVEEVVFDDLGWLVRYLVVDTRNWLPGRKVLIAPRWVTEINYSDSAVAVDLNQETIQSAPEFEKEKVLNREYEERLYRHYGRSGYWEDLESREERIEATSKASTDTEPMAYP